MLGFLWLVEVFGVRFVFSLPEEVVGVSLLLCPFFPFCPSSLSLVLGFVWWVVG